MADWLHKFGKSSDQEEPEDFVLLRKDADQDADNTAQIPAVKKEYDISMDDTGEIEPIYSGMLEENGSTYADYAPKNSEEDKVERIEYELDGVTPIIKKPEREPGFKGFIKAHKTWVLGGGITVAAIAILVALFMILSVVTDPMRGYSQAEVVKGNIINSMETAGTLAPNDRYTITSLVSGKIVESKPEVGDTVTAGTVLYKLDDTEAKLAVERAKNALSKSKVAGSASAGDSNKIYSTDTGTIHTLNIHSGSTVSYGQVVCTIKKSDNTVVAVTSPVAGTVSAVNVSQGKSVSVNTLIASVTSIQTSTNQKTSVYDQKSSELDVKTAEAQLKNYTIKSPVSGVIIEKNTKVGDNVGMTNMENPMMVILDNTSLKFTFQVDEYTLKDIENGLDVIVNTESLPDESFAGEVTRVGSQGTENDESKVMFEVDVTVDEPGDLKAGMKVTAKVILESATNVTYVPHKALMEADGENAVVLVKKGVASALRTSDSNTDELEEELMYPWIKVPEGCELVTVKYGVADGTNVEIIYGLEVGDVVVYKTDAEPVDLSPAPTETATPTTPDAVSDSNSSATAKPKASSSASKAADEAEGDTPESTASATATATAKPTTTNTQL